MNDSECRILSLEKTQQQEEKLNLCHTTTFYFLFFILGLINNLG